MYVSIEWSNEYDGDITENRYVVVVSSASEYNNNMANLYETLNRVFKRSYLQSTTVYTGSKY